MAVGDFLIRRNDAETDVLPNAGSNLDATWDIEVIDEGSAATYSAGTFTITNAGPHFISYCERFDTTNTTNNERIEGQGRLRIGGVDQTEGAAEGYIRKSSGQQEMIISGSCIYRTTGASTSLVTRFNRGDNSTSGTVDRVPDFGGVVIMQLDDNDDFARYSTNATQTVSTTEANVTSWQNDEQDTGFSRSGDTVTISNAGRYVMSVSGEVSITGTARTEGVIFAENSTTEIEGARGSFHMRGIDGCQNGAFNFTVIIDVAASDTITLRKDLTGGSTPTIASGMVWQFWELPSGNETAIMEATNGNQNATGPFAWDTLPQIDTGGFTATAGNSNIDVDQDCHLLAFWQMGKRVVDSPQRAYPLSRVTVDSIVKNYSAGGSYHRNSSSIGQFMSQGHSTLVENVKNNSSIEITIDPLGAGGIVDCDTGHFSLLNLEGLYKNYTYQFPPVVTDFNTVERYNWGDTNLVITGTDFGSVQGTGVVEIWDDIVGTTKVGQTVDTWAATSIQIDTVQGGLGSDNFFYLVVTDDNGKQNSPFEITEGIPTYNTTLLSTIPDHFWRYNNVLTDTGITGPQRDMSTEVGTTTYTTNNIVDDNTHALILNEATERIGPADSPNMNITIDAQRRTLCCWVQANSTEHPLSCIFKEGAQIQNMAFLLGYGGVVIAQMADTPGNPGNIQAWSDIKLTNGRPYHLCMRYSFPDEFRLFLDAVLQPDTDGNPLGAGAFNAHSGDIAIGAPDTTLETGGTDITYQGPSDLYISDFASWSENSAGPDDGAISDTNIRQKLFERGAVPDDTIVTGTESAMQTALDATLDARPDWPLSYRIEGVTGGGDFEQTMNDKVFDSRITLHVEYRGTDTLTLIKGVGSNLDSAKVFSTSNGTIVVINEVSIKVVVRDIDNSSLIEGVYVKMTATETVGTVTIGDVLLEGDSNASGVVETTIVYESAFDPSGLDYDLLVAKGSEVPTFIRQDLVDTITAAGTLVDVSMESDD